MAYPREDLRGLKFGRLTVLDICLERKNKSTRWICRCECGEIRSVYRSSLISGKTLSCGCLAKSINKERMTTHGAWGSRTHRIWMLMKARCLSPSANSYADYGGSGITVCERWLKFENFIADMGEAPAGMSIDRYPDMSGNYEPGNCRWATAKEQARNRRTSKMLTCGGKTQCLSAWAEELCVPPHILTKRLKRGMSLEAIVQKATKDPLTGLEINSTGFRGVKRAGDKWSARAVINGKRIYLGVFETAELASAAYESAKDSSANR